MKPLLSNSMFFSFSLICSGLLILSILLGSIFILFLVAFVLSYYIYKQDKKHTYKQLDNTIKKTNLKVGYVVIGEKKI